VVEPYDKRQLRDAHRLTEIESCCYVWLDAGRRLTITTRADKSNAEQREGPLITLIQTVMGMVTPPSFTMSGETLRRDIELVKLRFQTRGDLPAG
jgi:hypothetical protein